MSLYTRLVRPLLFLIPAEQAHTMGRRVLSRSQPWRALSRRFLVRDPRLESELGGVRVPSPVGLSPGFDKDAEALPGLSELGFGSLTIGTIMANPRPGNPGPRLLRVPREMGLINSLGLPSKGMHYGVRNLRLFRERRPAGDPLIIASVGAYRVEELLACYRAAEPWADALEVNFTCPNVHGDQGDFSKIEGVTRLAEKVMAERRKPVLFKLPPRTSTEKWERALAIADVAGEYGAEGISIMGGGPLVEDSRLAVGRGALTGRPAFEGTLRTVRDLRNAIDDRLAIKIAGGVFDGEDAFRLLEAGATYVDILTSFVYLGPSAATRITRELLQKMDAEGVSSVRDLRGRHRPAKISS